MQRMAEKNKEIIANDISFEVLSSIILGSRTSSRTSKSVRLLLCRISWIPIHAIIKKVGKP